MTQTKKFILKYLTKYYVYGYCCILGFMIQSLFIYFATKLPKPFNYVLLGFLLVGTILLFRKWLIITALSKKKYRFYIMAVHMLDKGSYDKNFFLNGMYDPCFRIMVKDLLKSYSLDDKYDELKKEIKIRKIPIMD